MLWSFWRVGTMTYVPRACAAPLNRHTAVASTSQVKWWRSDSAGCAEHNVV